jgi:hypothetical protein
VRENELKYEYSAMSQPIRCFILTAALVDEKNTIFLDQLAILYDVRQRILKEPIHPALLPNTMQHAGHLFVDAAN